VFVKFWQVVYDSVRSYIAYCAFSAGVEQPTNSKHARKTLALNKGFLSTLLLCVIIIHSHVYCLLI